MMGCRVELDEEGPMYIVVRRYSGASALVDAMVQREQEVRELISTVPGFRAYYAARTGGGGGVATVTVCDDKAGTDESTRRAGEWVRANVSGASIGPPEITEGETYITF
jgi:hypothetical protein